VILDLFSTNTSGLTIQQWLHFVSYCTGRVLTLWKPLKFRCTTTQCKTFEIGFVFNNALALLVNNNGCILVSYCTGRVLTLWKPLKFRCTTTQCKMLEIGFVLNNALAFLVNNNGCILVSFCAGRVLTLWKPLKFRCTTTQCKTTSSSSLDWM
jgi:hypothetical protein